MSPSKPTSESQATDQLFRVLSHYRRRSVLRVLQGAETMELSELVTQVAQLESSQGASDSDTPEPSAVRAGLYHCHIPKLVEAGLITRTKNGAAVTLSERTNSHPELVLAADEVHFTFK